jgi:hypothetical protein
MSEIVQPEWMKGFVPKPLANNGRWAKGQSGNPRGRPPGRPDARTKITRALLDEGLEIARVVTDAAKEGDLQAASLVLSRIAPALRPEAQPVSFDFDSTASPVRQIEAVLAAVAEGTVPVDLGKQLIDAIKALSDVRAAEELEARLAALEARQQ